MAALCRDCLAKQPELGFSNMLEQIKSLVVCKKRQNVSSMVAVLWPAKRPYGSVSISSLICLAKGQEHVWFIAGSAKWQEHARTNGGSVVALRCWQKGPSKATLIDLIGLMSESFLLWQNRQNGGCTATQTCNFIFIGVIYFYWDDFFYWDWTKKIWYESINIQFSFLLGWNQ